MIAQTLSPERVASIGRALRACIERARRLGQAQLCVHRERLYDAPSGLEVFARAEECGERRFLLAQPARGVERVAIGCTERARGTPDDVFGALIRRGDEARDEGAADAAWVGGIAFDPCPDGGRADHWNSFGSASFVLPELSLVRREGATWLTLATRVSGESDPDATLRRVGNWLRKGGPADARPDGRSRHGEPAALLAYRANVTEILRDIQRGVAEKVVLACEERRRREPGWRASAALRALLEMHPDATTFAQGIGTRTFLGATPELLVRRTAGQVASGAVAATAPRHAVADAEARLARELWSSDKERREHALVVDAITRALTPLCDTLEAPDVPSVLLTGSLQHLYTPIRGKLRKATHVLELARRLHPTPALGGHPRDRALALIREHEGFDRGWYAGPVGWFDAGGDGELWVALRCALAGPRDLRLFAGSGLVHDSDADRETRETGLKLRSVREAIDPW